MRKVIFELLLLGIAIGLTVEVIKSAIPYLPIIWLTVLGHYTWEALTYEPVMAYLVQARARLGLTPMYMYLIVGIAGAVLFLLYFAGLNTFLAPKIARYEEEQRVKEIAKKEPDNPKADGRFTPPTIIPSSKLPIPAEKIPRPDHKVEVHKPQSNPPPSLPSLTQVDRENLSKVYYELSEALRKGNEAWGKANRVKSDQGGGSYRADLEERKKRLEDARTLAKDFEQSLLDVRTRWNYYVMQIGAVLQQDPDNHALILRNAIDAYERRIDSVLAVKDSDSILRNLMSDEDFTYDKSITEFQRWRNGCEVNLHQAREGLN